MRLLRMFAAALLMIPGFMVLAPANAHDYSYEIKLNAARVVENGTTQVLVFLKSWRSVSGSSPDCVIVFQIQGFGPIETRLSSDSSKDDTLFLPGPNKVQCVTEGRGVRLLVTLGPFS